MKRQGDIQQTSRAGCPDMAWLQSCEIPHPSVLFVYKLLFLVTLTGTFIIEHLSYFFSDNPNLVSFVPVTVQVLDVNDNAPYIATDSALIVCEGYKAGQVSYLPSFLTFPSLSFSFIPSVILFQPLLISLDNPSMLGFSYHYSAAFLLCPIFFGCLKPSPFPHALM